MTNLWPFFTFYGGKWRTAPRYPKPEYDTIIEPFAGSAGYAMRYPEKQVQLFDSDPIICALWDYLIHVPVEEILRLPLEIPEGKTVRDLGICQQATWLIGFWLNKGCTAPMLTPSAWMRSGIRPKSYWGPEIRARIAKQLEAIRHWTITQADYREIGNQPATWFIDPPYQLAGKHYRKNGIDYPELGEWCQERQGQVMVCENTGANWLPFEHFLNAKATESSTGGKVSREAIWRKEAYA